MKGDAKSARREQIIEAAYAILAEKGYGGTSMLAVAKRANASNESLYNWFGCKQGLFTAMVEQNAAAAAAILKDHLAGGSDFSAAFARLGPTLLRLVTSERAVALNRAVAADATKTGVLGATIASSGRDHIVPLIEELFERAEDVQLPAGFTPQRGGGPLCQRADRRCADQTSDRCEAGTRRGRGRCPCQAGRCNRIWPLAVIQIARVIYRHKQIVWHFPQMAGHAQRNSNGETVRQNACTRCTFYLRMASLFPVNMWDNLRDSDATRNSERNHASADLSCIRDTGSPVTRRGTPFRSSAYL